MRTTARFLSLGFFVATFCCMLVPGLEATPLSVPRPVSPSGTVRDETTGKPLPGVHVEFFDVSGERLQEAFSDSLGRYSVDPGPKGTITYSLDGYETRRLDWPSDLKEGNSCICRFKDVTLRPRRISRRVFPPWGENEMVTCGSAGLHRSTSLHAIGPGDCYWMDQVQSHSLEEPCGSFVRPRTSLG